MREDLVNLVEVAESLRAELQASQPIRTHAYLLELLHVVTHQRGTLVPRCSLQNTGQKLLLKLFQLNKVSLESVSICVCTIIAM